MNNNNQSTTVIIPCHNYGKYISFCIESVLNQTRSPLEIIVINDSSTDDTDEIINGRYSSKVKYYKVSFKNAQKTRNFAIEKAKGEFFYLLDADDYIDSTAIETLEDTLVNHPSCKLAYSARFNVGDFNLIKQVGFSFVRSFPKFSRKELEKRNFIPMHSLVRRNKFKGFDDRINKTQDWEAWLNFLKVDTDAIYIDLPLFYYRFHGNNLTFTQNNEVFERLKILVKHSLFSHRELAIVDNMETQISRSIIIIHSPKKTDFKHLISFINGYKKDILQLYLTGEKDVYVENKIINILNENKVNYIESYDKNPDILLQGFRKNLSIFRCENLIISNFSLYVKNSTVPSINDSYAYFNIEDKDLLNLKSFLDTDLMIFSSQGIKTLLDIPSFSTQLFNIFNRKLLLFLNRHVLWRLKYKNR